MFSRLKSFHLRKGLNSFLKSFCVNQIRTLPMGFCNAVASGEQSFNIQEINVRLLSEVTSEPECVEKYGSIVEEIQKVITYNKKYPQFMNSDEIRVLCSLETRTQRKCHLAFLFKKERYKKSEAEKKEKKRLERESLEWRQIVSDFDHGDIRYGLGRNSFMISVWSHSMNKFYDKRYANAILFGEKVVFDLSYDEHMTDKEQRNTAVQLKLVCGANRKSNYPYDMYFCNASEASGCVQYFQKGLPKFKDSMFTVTDKTYLDVFPREKLVYLSPHAEETLKEYDHSAVYIIGAFVDTIKKTKVSSNKAEKEGIKSCKLPLDDYIMWGAGSKSLTINQVFEIMLVLKNTGDWLKAFQVIPHRKIRRIESEETDSFSNKIFLKDTLRNKDL